MKVKTLLDYCLILIFFSAIVSVLYSNYNIKHFDKNVLDQNEKSVHLMIKNDPLRYFSHGYEIKDNIKKSLNYFETGRNNFTKYLYPRIIALYYLVFDYELYEDPETKVLKTGIHFKYLVFQILFYYLSLTFLYFQLKKKIDKKYLFFCLIFLCLEPTLFQYHGSFWSESIFFSFQILIMSLMINTNFSNTRIFTIGILLSLLALQRSNGLYYIIPVLLYFFLSKDFVFFKKIIYLFIGFIFLPIIVGYDNYKKTDRFFIIPLETKSVLHAYVIPNILSEEDLEIEKNKFFETVTKENISINLNELENFNYSRYAFIYCDDVSKIQYSEKLKICDYFNKRSKEIIFSNPLKFFNFVAKKSISFALLNPFHIFSDHKFLSGEEYYKSDLHKKLIPYRVIYSLFIYLVCFFGLFELIKKRENNLLLYLIISSFYFFIILSWHGNNRYFTPVLIYLSIFFGYGFNYLVNKFRFKLKV